MPKAEKKGLGVYARQVKDVIFCGLRQLPIVSHDSSIVGTLYACPRQGACDKCPVAKIGKRQHINLDAGSDASVLVRSQKAIAKAFGTLTH